MAESPSELQTEIEKLEQKHAENPDGRYFVPLANDYRKTGELERAEALLRAGIEKHPDYLSARIVLGRCLADKGENELASGEFDYVLSMDPQNLIALRSLAELAAADGRRDDAERWYRELLAVDPMNDEARQALEAMPPAAERVAASGPEEAGSWWDPEVAGGETADVAGGDAAAGAEAVAEPAAPARVEEAQRSDFGDEVDEWDLPDEVGSVEVVTETIAELYARQGLHERAAGVYRELIKRRGGDAELEKRLAALEAAAQDEDIGLIGPAPEVPEITEVADVSEVGDAGDELEFAELAGSVAPTPAPREVEREDAFASSFAFGFTEGEDSAVDETPATVAADVREERVKTDFDLPAAPAGATAAPGGKASTETIGAYLASLAAWEPGQGDSDLDISAFEMAEPEEEEPAAAAAPAAAAPEAAAEEEIGEWEHLELEAAMPEPELPEPDLPEPDLPEPAMPEPDLPEPVVELDDYFSETEAQAPEPVERAAPASEDEDDDLESFQAWLRSLKR